MDVPARRPNRLRQCLVQALAASAACVALSGCGTFHSLSGPMRDAPCIYSGVRLDWAALRGDQHYVRQYRLVEPDHPAMDLPFSFAMDSLFLPLAVPRAIYQAIFVPSGL